MDFLFAWKEVNMAKGKVSGKTHTQAQLNDWANQNNSNNKAYKANVDNRANQLNPKQKTHQQLHNQERRSQPWVDWAPDYIDYSNN
jgi:hypothetical protein